MIEPVTLYDSTTITNGQSAILNAARMMPPGNRPMLVTDIIFNLRAANQSTNDFVQLGALVRCRIRIGRFDVSNNPIPTWLYGTVSDDTVDGSGNLALADAAGDFHNINRYKWTLPAPAYVPPGAAIQVTFTRDDSIATLPAYLSSTTPVTCAFSARGLLIHEKMKQTTIPFVGAFVPSTNQIRSREDDLRNTLAQPLNVHRMMGRIAASREQVVGSGLSDVVDGLSVYYTAAGVAEVFRNQIKVTDNNGLDITGGFVPMCSAFPAQGRSWTFKKTMAVGDQLIVSLDRFPTVAAWPMVSIIGSRVERV